MAPTNKEAYGRKVADQTNRPSFKAAAARRAVPSRKKEACR
jgi:hypothetical protein